MTCGLCGHRTHASLGARADGVDLCHGCVYGGMVPCPNNYDEPRSCYERWTVYGERPSQATP